MSPVTATGCGACCCLSPVVPLTAIHCRPPRFAGYRGAHREHRCHAEHRAPGRRLRPRLLPLEPARARPLLMTAAAMAQARLLSTSLGARASMPEARPRRRAAGLRIRPERVEQIVLPALPRAGWGDIATVSVLPRAYGTSGHPFALYSLYERGHEASPPAPTDPCCTCVGVPCAV